MVLRVTPQRPGIAVGFTTSLCFALERLLVSVRQHVAVPGKRERETDGAKQRDIK